MPTQEDIKNAFYESLFFLYLSAEDAKDPVEGAGRRAVEPEDITRQFSRDEFIALAKEHRKPIIDNGLDYNILYFDIACRHVLDAYDAKPCLS